MLIQLNATVSIGGASFGCVKDIIAPRVNSTQYNALAIRECNLMLIGGIATEAEACELAICNPRNWKGNALMDAPNSVIYWKQYHVGSIDQSKWLEPNRFRLLESVPIYLDWVSTVARGVMIQILFEEIKIRDMEQIDLARNNGWSV